MKVKTKVKMHAQAGAGAGEGLVLRFRGWLIANCVTDIRKAHAHDLGLPDSIREHPKPQGSSHIGRMIARRLSHLLGEQVFAPQAEVVISRLRIVSRASHLRSRLRR